METGRRETGWGFPQCECLMLIAPEGSWWRVARRRGCSFGFNSRFTSASAVEMYDVPATSYMTSMLLPGGMDMAEVALVSDQ